MVVGSLGSEIRSHTAFPGHTDVFRTSVLRTYGNQGDTKLKVSGEKRGRKKTNPTPMLDAAENGNGNNLQSYIKNFNKDPTLL